jgi:probable rRNA maturation factor|tara:strand:+ start:1181 stop:1642 length:462 start_codon:yes stop_codon:yes gene_type:complete
MLRQIEVLVEDDALAIDVESVEKLLHFLDAEVTQWTLPSGDLSVAFVTKERCSELHATFFNDPSITDVMTFPGDVEDKYAGDLAICPAHAASQAPDYGTTFPEELTLYLLHGWLHLAGLDDRSENDRSAMREAEKTLQAITGNSGYRLSVVYQ